MPIQSRMAAGACTPEQVNVIVAAFDGAWKTLETVHRRDLTDPMYAAGIREMLARRIIDSAKTILSAKALKAEALAYIRERLGLSRSAVRVGSPCRTRRSRAQIN